MDRSSFEASRRERAKQREVEGHLTPGDLAAYHAGRLTDERKGQIKDHLAVCEECALLYDSLIEFEQYRPEPDPSGEDPSAAAWLRFRERLREEDAAEAPAPAQEEENPRTAVMPLQRRVPVPAWKARVPWALAATLAAYAIGLTFWYANLRKEYNALNEPGFVHDVHLQPDGEGVERGGEGVEPEPVLSSAGKWHYELSLPEPHDDGFIYEVEILAGDSDKPLWNGQDRATLGYLTMEVPRSYRPGPYRFRIHRIEGNGSKTLVGTYSFNVP